MSDDTEAAVLCPAVVRANRTVGNTVFLGGVGRREGARIMFVAPAALEEECSAVQRESYGKETRVKPSHLKGPAGAIFKDLALSCGIDLADNFYVSICRWLLPRARRLKPSKSDLTDGMLALRTDINEIKPEIIVCLGKPAFDQFVDIKVKLQDISGGWFRSEEFNCLVYPMDTITKLVSKPEYYERFKMDLREVRRMRDKLDGKAPPEVPEDYRVVRTSAELNDLVDELLALNVRLLSVDGEWHGMNHVDGSLRSLQLCWAPGKAAYIMFMNERMEYVFDVPYREAGAILSRLCDRPELKYVGHHISADLPWMHHVLGLEWYRKAFMDTEFAQQTEDEHAELGLERLGMLHSTLGRYDLELTLWCKKNSKLVQDGYGLIPDEIIIPYACRDVDVVMRSYPRILRGLTIQGLNEYYFGIFNPFVTDVFTNFALQGLPINEKQLTQLRDLYHYVRDELDAEFRAQVKTEADNMMLQLCMKYGDMHDYFKLVGMVMAQEHEAAADLFKRMVGVKNLLAEKPLFDHFLLGSNFNIRSPEQMKRWLFQVKKYTPIKSTNNREKGMPSMDWSKVMELDPSRQSEFTPSTDKQTLEILAATHKDALLKKLLRLNAVGNICKAFLKKGHTDKDGEVDREAGLHFFLSSDGRVHGQMSATETGRPRSWKPNSLNWPSWINKLVAEGMEEVLVARKLSGTLPEEFGKYLKWGENKKTKEMEWQAKIPSIRSCVEAPPGWCMVESDYQTAEIRGLAFISQDEDLINIITKPDRNFAKVRPEFMVDEDCVCRLDFPPELESVGDEIKDKLRMTYTVDGVELARFEKHQLLHDDRGNVVHSKADLHWSLAEMVHNKPRELLIKKRDRGAAKVGNFSSAYGASPDTIERKIESDTGIKPEPGTGQGILDALAMRQPRATAFLEQVAEAPVTPGYLRAASGRIRHFHTHGEIVPGMSGRQQKGILAAMGREGRNYFMQESVASTAAIAGAELLDFGRRNGLKGSPMTILYDSVVTLCPLEEREIWAKAHELFMFRGVGWAYGPNILNYPIDTELNLSWSSKPDKATLAQLTDMSWHPVPDDKKHLLTELDLALDKHKSDATLGVRNKRDLPTEGDD